MNCSASIIKGEEGVDVEQLKLKLSELKNMFENKYKSFLNLEDGVLRPCSKKEFEDRTARKVCYTSEYTNLTLERDFFDIANLFFGLLNILEGLVWFV